MQNGGLMTLSQILSTISEEVNTSSINSCTQNLEKIGKALISYEKEHNNLPEWLSELHPNYLTDSTALICPADEDKGIPVLAYNTDPNLPVSYYYDFDPDYREWTNEERRVYDDANPVVRCNHHANINSESTFVKSLHINLSYSNSIYLSEVFWYKCPEKMYGSLQAAVIAYEKALERVSEDPNFFKLYPELIRLYVLAEKEKDVDILIEKFKTVMKPDEDIMRFRDYFTLLEMLRAGNKHNESLKLCEHLERTEQKNIWLKSLYREFAVTYEELGNKELADTYFHKYDSKREMLGKTAPDFSVTDMDSVPISLKDFRGKVLILDFWATWCGPCIGEMPNVMKIYDTYHEMGLDVIGINRDKDEEEPREFLNKYQLPWRQIFDGAEGPLKELYRVGGIPSLWLIDREGTIISYGIRGAELKKRVDEIIDENSSI